MKPCRKIRIIEGNAKCLHLKKSTCEGTFATGVYLFKALHTVYVYTRTVRILNTYSHREWGGGERVEPERRLEGQQFTKVVENTNMTDCISGL
jgi:hypothetical protein